METKPTTAPLDLRTPATDGLTPKHGARRWFWLVLALPLVALGPSIALAELRGGGGIGMMGEGGMRQRMEHMLTAVGATDAQKTAVKAVWEGRRPQLKNLHQEQHRLRKQMAELLGAPVVDAAKIEQLRKQSMQNMESLSAVMTEGLVASANALTPAQRKLAVERFEAMRDRHDHGHDHGDDDNAGNVGAGVKK